MKKFLFLLASISFIGLLSCEKTPRERPGEIPGMGNSRENLQVKEPFIMPDGILLLGDITGLENSGLKSALDIKSSNCYYGSGRYVRLQLTLLNTKSYARTVYFPKGLVWECKNGASQHGLQCQTTWICLQPNSTRTIMIDLYCVNLDLPRPNLTTTYKILGITNSQILWSFLNTIGWRKVNYEMCYGVTKAEEIGPAYSEITERLQNIVYNLTDRAIEMSDEDKAFIESIPELKSDEIPIVDENSKYPEYFEEFKVGSK